MASVVRFSAAAGCGRRAHPAPTTAFRRQQLAAPAGRRRSASRVSRQVMCSAVDTGAGKLISKVEIPAFIPRSDLLDQLMRWSFIEIQEGGVANVGCPCKVDAYRTEEGLLWGFTVSFLRDGLPAAELRIAFDEEDTVKHEWVGRGADGFPILEGNSEAIAGKNFEIRKIDIQNKVTEDLRQSIRDFCTLLVAAINKYYAFGSCFVDDAT